MSKLSEENKLNLFPYLYAYFPPSPPSLPPRSSPAWLRAQAATRGQERTSVTEKGVTKGETEDLQKASSIITARDILKAQSTWVSPQFVLNSLIAHSIPFQDQTASLQASPLVRKSFIPPLPFPNFPTCSPVSSFPFEKYPGGHTALFVPPFVPRLCLQAVDRDQGVSLAH